MTANKPLRLAVLFSGGGSTMTNLNDHIQSGQLDATVAWTLASRADVAGIDRARQAGLPCHVLPRREFGSAVEYSQAIGELLEREPVDLVVMAGFMSLFLFPETYRHRVINVHPALIPAFCGKGMYGHYVHEAVIETGVKLTGATVHFADHEYDHGPIIMQESIPVWDDDTPETIAERVQALERKLYPKAIQLIAENRIQIDGRRVRIRPAAQQCP